MTQRNPYSAEMIKTNDETYFIPLYKYIEDKYGNEYRVWNRKDVDDYWTGEIVTKSKTLKSGMIKQGKIKSFKRKKKKAVWAILDRHHDKKNKQFEEAKK